MLTHDIIKIQYSREGYLPDYPYHMISDREMFNAFICIDYKLTISDGGTGYSVGDIMYTDVHDVFAEVKDVAADGAILKVSQSESNVVHTSGTGAVITANKPSDCYMDDYYPCPSADYIPAYDELVSAIKYHIKEYLNDNSYEVPAWVYTYMIGEVICPSSEQLDRHDLLVLLDLDNPEDEFTPEVYASIYDVSQKWVSKLNNINVAERPATMYGEPHVIKSLRLGVQ